ncbi:hypothetical protein C9374_001196 [Naegleria lovaniensis]|uniref:Uncharacterized protein n=1 Tax=Naegleria lovaniensis TaxID=51637 RepID=A0AA88GV84_NAELO|nr:uncharacterized protein C9374_001196 [Naegleria lovaniensis]KAG2387602.1 hypothetical protein C9374_001196 [Naegleria lovaniensis]
MTRFSIFRSGSRRNVTKDLVSEDDQRELQLEQQRKLVDEATIMTSHSIYQEILSLYQEQQQQQLENHNDMNTTTTHSLHWFCGSEKNRVLHPYHDEVLTSQEISHVKECLEKLRTICTMNPGPVVSEETLLVLTHNRTIPERFFHIFFNPHILEHAINVKGLKPYMKVRLLFKQVNGKFGIFDSCLLVGCWRLEWNENSSLVCVKQFDTSRLHFAIDLERFTDEEKIIESLKIISNECCVWNGSRQYDVKSCNAQHFVLHILEKIGINLDQSLKGLSKIYFNSLLLNGTGTTEIELTEELKQQLEMTQTPNISFHNHKQLDLFLENLNTKNPYYFPQNTCDQMLLKCFDECYWKSIHQHSNGEEFNYHHLKNCSERDRPLLNDETNECQCHFNKNPTCYGDYVASGKTINNVLCSQKLSPPFPLRKKQDLSTSASQ